MHNHLTKASVWKLCGVNDQAYCEALIAIRRRTNVIRSMEVAAVEADAAAADGKDATCGASDADATDATDGSKEVRMAPLRTLRMAPPTTLRTPNLS